MTRKVTGSLSLARSFWGPSYVKNAMHIQYFDGTIQDENEALSLIPPLVEGTIPHPYEVVFRSYRANALMEKGDLSSSLDDFRSRAAAIRLRIYDDQVARPEALEFLTRKCAGIVTFIVQLQTKFKVQNKAKRPFFTTEELNDLEKELGIGLYSKGEYKCGKCDTTPDQVKPVLCSGVYEVVVL
jgi:hypothetical protein